MITTVQGFSDFMGGIGNFPPGQVQTALMLAEARVQHWLCTFLEPTQYTEEFPWPVEDGKLFLKYVRLISLDVMTGLYWVDQTTCEWVTTPMDCGIVFDNRMSIVQILDTIGLGICCGYYRSSPTRLRLTYTAGFASSDVVMGTPDGTILQAGIFNAALGFLVSTVGLQSTGNVFIPSFSAAGYNESRQLVETSGAELLMNQHIQNARQLIRPLEVRRPIQLTVRRKVFFR